MIITQRDQHQVSVDRISINKHEFLSTNAFSINRSDLVCKFCFCDHPQTTAITLVRNWELKTLCAITLEMLILFNTLNSYQQFRGWISVLQIDFAKTVWDSSFSYTVQQAVRISTHNFEKQKSQSLGHFVRWCTFFCKSWGGK